MSYEFLAFFTKYHFYVFNLNYEQFKSYTCTYLCYNMICDCESEIQLTLSNLLQNLPCY